MNNFDLLLAFAAAACMSIALIPFLMKHAEYLGMIDTPDERKVHDQAIPRCGGLAIAISVLSAIIILASHNAINYGLLFGGLIIVVFGILDDAVDLHYRWKFLGQFLAVAVVIALGVQFEKLPFFGLENAPVWLTLPITVLFIVGVTNAVNLSDGLDGLAAGTMLLSYAYIAAFAVYFGGADVALIALAVIGGLIGFLRYNTHPAIVFMGDTGSQFIGFMAANLSIMLTQQINPVFSPALPLLILGLPILDTLSVMIQRIRVGKSPFSPDKRHIHHKLMRHGFQHSQAVAIIYIIQSAFLLGAFLFRYATPWTILGYYSLLTGCILSSFYLASKFNLRLGAAEEPLERRHIQFWRQEWLFKFCRQYIESVLSISLMLLIVFIYFNSKISLVVEILLFALSLFCVVIFPQGMQLLLVRLAFYIGGAVSIYAVSSFSASEFDLGLAIDIYFLLLILVTILAVRITRKAYFSLNNQDLLVLLFLIVTIALVNVDYLVRGISYLCCLGYALEYLLNREGYKFRVLRVLAFIFLLNVGMLMWQES